VPADLEEARTGFLGKFPIENWRKSRGDLGPEWVSHGWLGEGGRVVKAIIGLLDQKERGTPQQGKDGCIWDRRGKWKRTKEEKERHFQVREKA